MRYEIKEAQSVFKSCEEFKNCTHVEVHRPFTKNATFTNHTKLTTHEFIQIMDENYGACSNPDQPYTRVKWWIETGKLDYNHCKYKHDLVKNFEN